MLSATVWNYGGVWSNFDFEYHFKIIKMMHEKGRYPLSYDQEYDVGFYPPLSHIIVQEFILAIGDPSLTVEGSLQRPWTEMFMLNSFVNALQVIPIFMVARRLSQSNLAGMSASLLIVVNGFQTWPVMGPFPDLYGIVIISFALYLLFEASLGGGWAWPKYALAGVFLVMAGFTHPLSYVFSIAVPLGVLFGRLINETIAAHRLTLRPDYLALLILSVVSAMVPGVSYYAMATPSGLEGHVAIWLTQGIDYYDPVGLIVSNSWLTASLAVLGYLLWRRRRGAITLSVWLIMPLILTTFYKVMPPYTLILARYSSYGQPYFTQPQAILLGSGIAFLLQEATTETDFRTRKVNQLRLLLLGFVVTGAIFKAGELLTSPSAMSALASIKRLQQGVYNFSTLSDTLSNIIYLGLGVSVCVIIVFSVLKYLVSRCRQRARPRWNDRILG